MSRPRLSAAVPSQVMHPLMIMVSVLLRSRWNRLPSHERTWPSGLEDKWSLSYVTVPEALVMLMDPSAFSVRLPFTTMGVTLLRVFTRLTWLSAPSQFNREAVWVVLPVVNWLELGRGILMSWMLELGRMVW